MAEATVRELRNKGGEVVDRPRRKRAARQAHLLQAEADFEPIPFDAAAARAFDAMIAATAIASGLPLHTSDPDGYAGIGNGPTSLIQSTLLESAETIRAVSIDGTRSLVVGSR